MQGVVRPFIEDDIQRVQDATVKTEAATIVADTAAKDAKAAANNIVSEIETLRQKIKETQIELDLKAFEAAESIERAKTDVDRLRAEIQSYNTGLGKKLKADVDENASRIVILEGFHKKDLEKIADRKGSNRTASPSKTEQSLEEISQKSKYPIFLYVADLPLEEVDRVVDNLRENGFGIANEDRLKTSTFARLSKLTNRNIKRYEKKSILILIEDDEDKNLKSYVDQIKTIFSNYNVIVKTDGALEDRDIYITFTSRF